MQPLKRRIAMGPSPMCDYPVVWLEMDALVDRYVVYHANSICLHQKFVVQDLLEGMEVGISGICQGLAKFCDVERDFRVALDHRPNNFTNQRAEFEVVFLFKLSTFLIRLWWDSRI
jgi:hypothetical protein